MADNTKQDLVKVKDIQIRFDCPRCDKVDVPKRKKTVGLLICPSCYNKIKSSEWREKTTLPSYRLYWNAYTNKMRKLRLAKKKGVSPERKVIHLEKAKMYDKLVQELRPIWKAEWTEYKSKKREREAEEKSAREGLENLEKLKQDISHSL